VAGVTGEPPFRYLFLEGERLRLDEGPGRRVGVDRRCVEGEPVAGAYVHLCALADDDARVPYDQPEVQQARRDALAWWVPMLGDDLVCLSTLSVDAVHCAGAVTVTRTPRSFADDPFARLFPGRVLRSDVFCPVAPPAGPVLERYAGAPWPGGAFETPSEGGHP
jgi:hypothetical protein